MAYLNTLLVLLRWYMFNFDLNYLKLDPGIQKTEEDS